MAAILKRVFHHNVDVPIRFLWTQKEPWYQAKSIALFLGISNLPRALSMCPPDSAKTLYELSLIYGAVPLWAHHPAADVLYKRRRG